LLCKSEGTEENHKQGNVLMQVSFFVIPLLMMITLN